MSSEWIHAPEKYGRESAALRPLSRAPSNMQPTALPGFHGAALSEFAPLFALALHVERVGDEAAAVFRH